jgi:hypothetical protein
MVMSGISAVSPQASSQQAMQTLGPHKHGGHHHSASLSDIDAQGSSLASAASSTGKVGSKVDLTA